MYTMFIASLLAGSASLISDVKSSDARFDWEGNGSAFLSSHGFVDQEAGLDGLLDSSHFAHVSLGSFKLYIPVKQLRDPEQAELFQEFALVALDLQSTWHGWRGTEIGSDQPEKDWRALRKWVDGWKPKKLDAIEGGAHPINNQIKGGDKLGELQKRLARSTQTNPKMANHLGERNKIVFAPRRQDFIELLSVAGLLDKGQRKYVWDDLNLTRTAAWINWVEVLCFEEAAWPFDIKHPLLGQSMNREEPTTRTEFIADRMTLQLMRKEFYPNGTHFFELSLGTNLVIEVLGHNNSKPGDWSVSNNTASGQTQPYSRFVPGGNSAGGTLPPRKAAGGPKTGSATQISRYRKHKGAKFFQASLKTSQKEASKLAKSDKENPLASNKLAHFVLHSWESGQDSYVSAPFLGPLAESKTMPANEFIDDYEDFFRAYRSGFLHWLASEAPKDAKETQRLFAKLIQTQSSRAMDIKFAKVIEDVYDMPLSAMDDSEDSLEWHYLAWIKKSR